MGNPYRADLDAVDGTVRFSGSITFTDPANQPGGSSAVFAQVSLRGGDLLAWDGSALPFDTVDAGTLWNAATHAFDIGVAGWYAVAFCGSVQLNTPAPAQTSMQVVNSGAGDNTAADVYAADAAAGVQHPNPLLYGHTHFDVGDSATLTASVSAPGYFVQVSQPGVPRFSIQLVLAT